MCSGYYKIIKCRYDFGVIFYYNCISFVRVHFVCKFHCMQVNDDAWGGEGGGGEGRVSLVFRRTNGKGSGCTKGMHKGLISNTVDSTRGII